MSGPWGPTWADFWVTVGALAFSLGVALWVVMVAVRLAMHAWDLVRWLLRGARR